MKKYKYTKIKITKNWPSGHQSPARQNTQKYKKSTEKQKYKKNFQAMGTM